MPQGLEEIDDSTRFLSAEVLPGGSTTFFTVQRISPTQGLYHLGETHDHNYSSQEGNLLTMERFCEILRKADNDPTNKDKYHILVESSSDHNFTFRDIMPKGIYVIEPTTKYQDKTEEELIEVSGHLLTGLIPLHKQRPFKKTIIEDCEVRRKFGGFMTIVEWFVRRADPVKMAGCADFKNCFKEKFHCDLGTITFGNIIEEFDELFQNGISYKNHWDCPKIKDRIQHDLDLAQALFELPRKLLTEENVCAYGIEGSTIKSIPKIFLHCTAYLQRAPKSYVKLFESMRRPFSHLFDIYLLHRILILRQENIATKIVLIAGAFHTRSVYVHLALAEEADLIMRLKAREHFLQDHLKDLEDSLEEVEARNSSWCTIL